LDVERIYEGCPIGKIRYYALRSPWSNKIPSFISLLRLSSAGMLHEFMVIGRKTPTERDPEPTVYKMRLFAPDAPKARSRFWVSFLVTSL
jgi:hypothetical protein